MQAGRKWPRILPMVLQCGQAVLASNSIGNFMDFGCLKRGTPLSSFVGVCLTPRRYLNSPTYAAKKLEMLAVWNKRLESASTWVNEAT